MRLRHCSGRIVHLSSGLNVGPARNLAAVVEQLDVYAAAIRARLGIDTLGVSLWLPPDLAAVLAVDARARTRLRAELDARALEVVTLSGVPYAEDGGENSTDGNPYAPDWSEPARLEYTLDLARILVDLLPEDAVRGAVTTLGLGRRAGWDTAKERACSRILRRLSAGLAEVAWQTGRAVRVGFQPEPGFVLDATDPTVTALAKVDRDRIGVCLDLADLACTWEDPARALERLAQAGIPVIRAQVAAAVEVASPAAAAEVLRTYVHPGRRHPVTNPAGAYLDDLSEALTSLPGEAKLGAPANEPGGGGGTAPPGPWRVRYHVPLHIAPAAPLAATTDVWRSALRHLMGGAAAGTEHLDVGTSSWEMQLPGDAPARADVVAGELAYTRNELERLGLSPPAQACAA